MTALLARNEHARLAPVVEILTSWLARNHPFVGFEQFAIDLAPHVSSLRREISQLGYEHIYINDVTLVRFLPSLSMTYQGRSAPSRPERAYGVASVLRWASSEDDSRFHLLIRSAMCAGSGDLFLTRGYMSSEQCFREWLERRAGSSQARDVYGRVIGEFTRGPKHSGRFLLPYRLLARKSRLGERFVIKSLHGFSDSRGRCRDPAGGDRGYACQQRGFMDAHGGPGDDGMCPRLDCVRRAVGQTCLWPRSRHHQQPYT